jgi:hypothetical protein
VNGADTCLYPQHNDVHPHKSQFVNLFNKSLKTAQENLQRKRELDKDEIFDLPQSA